MRARSRLAAVAATVFFFATAAQAADTEDLGLLPSNGDIVVQIDVKALAGTPLVKGIIEQAKASPDVKQQFETLKAEYGIDPERDIERLTIMVPASSASGQALMVLNTSASFETLLAGARKNAAGLAERTHGGVTYHVEDKVAMAQVGKRIVVGDEALLKAAIDGKGKKGLLGNAQMMGLVKRASAAGGQVWFAAVLPESVKAKMAADDPRAKDISTVQGSLDLKSGLSLKLDIGAKKGTSDAMVAELNKQLAQAKVEQAGNPMMAAMGLGAVIDGIKASAEGDEVRIKLDLTQAQVDQLKAMAMMMAGMAGAMQQGTPPGIEGGSVTPPPAAPMQKAQ